MNKIKSILSLVAILTIIAAFNTGVIYAQINHQTEETAVGTVSSGSGGALSGSVYFYCQYGGVNSSGKLNNTCSWNIPSKKCFYDGPEPSSEECDIGGAGCAPTSIAMILSTLGEKVSPTDVALASNRTAGCGGKYEGTNGYEIETYLSPWLKRNGYTITGNLVSGGKLNTNAARNFIDNGYLVVGGANVRYMITSGYSDKYSGHAFVLSGYSSKTSDDFIAYDPTFCEGTGFGGQRKLNDVNNSGPNGNDNVKGWFFAYAIKKGG